MEDHATFFGALLEKVETYSKTTIDLIKLKAVDKLTVVASSIILGVTIFILSFFFLMIFNMAIAFWIGEAIGKIYLGFFIVAAFYVLLIILILVFKKQLIKTPITNTLISKFLK